jgi:PBP1b-binding outer membrane lipoprotein LpoB
MIVKVRMKTKGSILFLSLVILLTLFVTGCQAEPSALSDEQVVKVTESILNSINDMDYENFTQDFGEEMMAAISEDDFVDMRTMLQSSSGIFIACQQPALMNNAGYAIYRVICEFEQEDVVVTVTFKVDGDKVEGLFFDSPNLRELKP